MKDYNSAVEKSPKFSDGFFARGNAKMNLKDYYGAIADFTTAILLNENLCGCLFQPVRGLLRINFGNAGDGCLDLSKAGELGDLTAYEDIKEKCNQKDRQ